MRIIKVYGKIGYFEAQRRKYEEKRLFAQGYKIVCEEDVKVFDGCLGCSLFLLFAPLVLLARPTKVRVTYEN